MPDHPDFDLDEAISADLDDELAPFAAELGLDLPTLRARMAEQPEYPDRLAALDTARQSLRAPVEALDDVSRARLLRAAPITEPRTTATTGTPVRREHAWRILGAAAAVVLVVGGGAALLRDGGSSSSAKSKAASGASARVRSGELGRLGSLDPKKLDSLIGGGSGATGTAGDPRAGSAPTSLEASSAARSKGSDSRQPVDAARPDAPTDASVTPGQVAACRAEYAKVGNVRFSGTGDYQFRPAVVLGVETGGRTIVFVVAATDCSEVLVSVSR